MQKQRNEIMQNEWRIIEFSEDVIRPLCKPQIPRGNSGVHQILIIREAPSITHHDLHTTPQPCYFPFYFSLLFVRAVVCGSRCASAHREQNYDHTFGILHVAAYEYTF